MPLGLPLHLARIVFELALCGGEGVANRGLKIFSRLVAHREFRAFDLHVDADIVRTALLMVSDRRVNRDLTIDYFVVVAFELGGFLANFGLEPIRQFEIPRSYFKRTLHAKDPDCSRAGEMRMQPDAIRHELRLYLKVYLSRRCGKENSSGPFCPSPPARLARRLPVYAKTGSALAVIGASIFSLSCGKIKLH
jgi:hypothetical protein